MTALAKKLIWSLVAGAWCLAPAQAAGTVDGSLEEVAAQIVTRTQADEPPTIGISTFTHGDGTCSELSNYVTEFIVDSLFNAGEGKINIIERSQLSAIFREMELVFDGTIAPDAAKQLGEIEGVDAIVTGSLIQFGEQVKMQARLISTENGRLFATARSSFPSVGSVANMMATRSRAQCGFSPEADDAGTGTGAGGTQVVVVDTGGAAGGGQAQGLAEPSRRFSSDVYEAEVSSLVYSKSKGEMSVSMRFKNTSENPIGLSFVPKTLSVADGAGGFMEYKDNWSGIRTCYSASALHYCNTSSPQYATTVQPGKVSQLNFLMQGAKDLESPKISLAMEFVVTPNTADIDSYEVQSVGFYDMVPDGA
ncbi:CsgG/HfaB family protein [Roseovarius sp. SCSIO 43702]|uniref:CsgG/HfaB family protein n=1 Tax=Roseovarius sp. SCSIO 43702 TaxID=2823043 RepID=UPI001C731DBC|nr:CsgG/HfaB family protein [Roseovarius sp. SCSIO 43702]QYX56745.1 CsgG/HfaB family protein [Roseovarius sp. SCSIO 43702]